MLKYAEYIRHRLGEPLRYYEGILSALYDTMISDNKWNKFRETLVKIKKEIEGDLK